MRNCHSVILSSGTLSPMETFQSELGVKFEHQLEANHVISDKQVWVGSLGYGPTDVNLLTTYKTCETLAYQDELGRLVLDICKAIPYGVLCFLPSYSLLNKLWTRWTESKLMDKIKVYKKVFNENKVAKNFDQLLADYYDCIDNSKGGETNNGALLLAVYRGRASEGLDFSDNYARAVIACGIPYPNIKDAQVEQKRKYNNLLCRERHLLNGDEWYEIQAYRAVNQALGRCIRHRNDWGAIILVDDRYFKNPQKYAKGLSKWIRQRYKTYRNYNEALQSITSFSKEMREFNGNFHASSQSILPTESQVIDLVKSEPDDSSASKTSSYFAAAQKPMKVDENLEYKPPLHCSTQKHNNSKSKNSKEKNSDRSAEETFSIFNLKSSGKKPKATSTHLTDSPILSNKKKRLRAENENVASEAESSSSTPKQQRKASTKSSEPTKTNSDSGHKNAKNDSWFCINEEKKKPDFITIEDSDTEEKNKSVCSLDFDDEDSNDDFAFWKNKQKKLNQTVEILRQEFSIEDQDLETSLLSVAKGENSFILENEAEFRCLNCANIQMNSVNEKSEVLSREERKLLPKEIRNHMRNLGQTESG